MNLLTYPNQNLRRISAPIAEPTTEEIQQLIPQLTQVMLAEDGIGLAAPQVGLAIRLIIVNADGTIMALINPEVVSRSFSQSVFEEGCLSVPGVYGNVRRTRSLKLRWQTTTGELKEESVDGLFARVVQHEIDHLDGVLFIDKMHEVTKGEEKLAEIQMQRD